MNEADHEKALEKMKPAEESEYDKYVEETIKEFNEILEMPQKEYDEAVKNRSTEFKNAFKVLEKRVFEEIKALEKKNKNEFKEAVEELSDDAQKRFKAYQKTSGASHIKPVNTLLILLSI